MGYVILAIIIVLSPIWILSGIAWKAGMKQARMQNLLLDKLEKESEGKSGKD